MFHSLGWRSRGSETIIQFNAQMTMSQILVSPAFKELSIHLDGKQKILRPSFSLMCIGSCSQNSGLSDGYPENLKFSVGLVDMRMCDDNQLTFFFKNSQIATIDASSTQLMTQFQFLVTWNLEPLTVLRFSRFFCK